MDGIIYSGCYNGNVGNSRNFRLMNSHNISYWFYGTATIVLLDLIFGL